MHTKCAAAVVAALAGLLAWAPSAFAQRLNITPYTTVQGLPGQGVRSVFQDSRGFIWIATDSGVARYDGNTIVRFTERDGLIDNDTVALAEDSEGRIIVATARGISVIVAGRIAPPTALKQLSGHQIRDVAAAAEGVWVLTTSAVLRVDVDPLATRMLAGTPVSALTVAAVPDGGALVGGNGFVRRLEEDQLGKPLRGVHSTLRVSDIVTDQTGRPWLATNAGIFRWNGTRFEKFRSPTLDSSRVSRVHSGALAPDGSLWFGAWGGAVQIESGQARLITEANGLPHATVRALSADRDGTIWMATDAGLAKLVPGPFLTYGRAQGMPSDVVLDVAEDRAGDIWVATDRGVAVVHDGFVNTPSALRELRLAQPTAVAIDDRGRVVVGSSQGLYVVEDDRLRLFRRGAGLPSSRVTTITSDDVGALWIGLDPGLARWRDDRLEQPQGLAPLREASVRALAQDSAGRLWIATERAGLQQYDIAADRLLDVPARLADLDALTFASAPDGSLWIGTAGSGAYRIAGTDISQLSTATGLTDDFVHQIVSDGEGRIWLYTNRGLDRISADGTISHFDAGDGLVALDGSTGAGLRDGSDRLWFGTARGLTMFDPRLEVATPREPLVVIIGATAGSDPISITDIPEISRRDAVTVEFAALTYRNERQNAFRYRLAGLDAGWSVPVTERQVSYGGLAPGSYTFEVLALSAEGIASAEPASLPFRVLPLFYETIWFRALAVAGLLLLGYLGFRWRSRRLVKERNKLAQLVEHRSSELAEQIRETAGVEAVSRAKSEFLAKTSHEVRTPINGVLGMAELLMFTPLTPRQRQLTRTIKQSGESLLDLINDILDVSKIEAGHLTIESTEFELLDTIGHVIDVLAEKARAKSIELRCNIDPFVPTDLLGDPLRLRQVLLNLIDNAVKFTLQGYVALVVDLLDDRDGKVRIRFRVEDTGIGITESAQRAIFEAFEQADVSTTRKHGGTGLGLSIARQLVEAMGGELHLNSQLGRGTIFSFAVAFGEQSRFSPREMLTDATVLLVGFDERQAGALERQLVGWKARGRSYTAAQVEDQAPALSADLAAANLVLAHAQSSRPGLSVLRRLHSLTPDGPPVLLLVPPGESLVEIEEAVGTDSTMLQSPPSPRRLYTAIQTSLDAETSATSAAPAAASAGRFAGHVLVAEDNPVNVQITTGMLQVLGCTMEVAADGAQAAELFAAGKFDLVLMDCEMTGTDGYEATTLIRALERDSHRARTPIVALTASAIDEVKQRCHDVGMDGFLGKPHTLHDLSEVLGRWLQTRSGALATAPAPVPEVATEDLADLDPRALEQIHALQRPGEPSLLDRVIASFLESAAVSFAELEKAARSNDAEALRTAAHGLKAASGNVGAHRMMSTCRQLEVLGRSGSTAAAADLLPQLDEELAAVTTLLQGEARKVVNE